MAVNITYLKQNKKGDRTHLVIARGYREKKKKKVRTKTIKPLGYLDKLEKQYLDPIIQMGLMKPYGPELVCL
jgi:uncharacterized protein YdeI (YjbR/CyaY-like superfamily)